MEHYFCPDCGACFACGNEGHAEDCPTGQKLWEDYVDENGYG